MTWNRASLPRSSKAGLTRTVWWRALFSKAVAGGALDEHGCLLFSDKTMSETHDYSWIFSLPLDVIWKHRMGERHCTVARLVVVTIAMQFWFMLIVFFLMGCPS